VIILQPKTREAAYKKAALIFQEYYAKITGKILEIIQEPSETEDMVVIGSDAVQPFVYKKTGGGFDIRYDTDDYCLVSKEDNGRNLLFLAGGRGRSTIYAVYDFFERRCGCHYFWDGDVVPKAETIDISRLNVVEKPRFTYRAIRYFAHRGLKRFQAEHWDFEDWKKEIDWLCKKRLNTFMLRIGMDDMFQKAFPDIVEYPSNESPLPEAGEWYDNRTTFWSLKYRGELRKRIMDYAFECGLMHPEDCGTMTHWYSRTPKQFLEKVKPGFLSQISKGYSELTGLVWDIFDEENLNNYWKLTDASIKEYGKPELFHTIGLAERTYSDDRKVNLNLKKYVYKKIIDYVSRTNPNAPLMIASWDFVSSLESDEVAELLRIFNPDKTIVLDYTVDLQNKENNFETWGIIGKIPWIFGIFYAYEPQNHVHGDYEYISKKLEIAEKDPMCKGMALWSEYSHCDSLMMEYFSENAWHPTGLTIEETADRLCEKRYGADSQIMKKMWNALLPVLKLPDKCYIPFCFDLLEPEFARTPVWKIIRDEEIRKDYSEYWKTHAEDIKDYEEDMRTLLGLAAELPADLFEKPFIRRDVVDMLRTIVFKKLQYTYAQAIFGLRNWSKGVESESVIMDNLKYGRKLLAVLGDALGLCEDYSMYNSFVDLGKNRKLNPYFEEAYKENVVNYYSRAGVYEVVKGVYEKEADAFNSWAFKNLEENNRVLSFTDELKCERDKIFSDFKNTPLDIFHVNEKPAYKTVVKRLAELI